MCVPFAYTIPPKTQNMKWQQNKERKSKKQNGKKEKNEMAKTQRIRMAEKRRKLKMALTWGSQRGDPTSRGRVDT